MTDVPSATFLSTLPGWAATLARTVAAKQANTFVIHGLPADLIPVRRESGLACPTIPTPNGTGCSRPRPSCSPACRRGNPS